MARPVPSLPMQKLSFLSMSVTSLFLLIGVFSVFSIVTFLCGSHTRQEERTVRLGDKKLVSMLQSKRSGKAVSIVKLISWRKVQDDDEDKEKIDDDEAVWRRTIIMGEKCRPLEFSGKILYDCNGNLLPSSPNDQSQGGSLV